ncbi:hypothetical protein Pcinc_027662 [Petrolisthes cinctipes]|uniref:U-box domain-containing protein n=2 Tax=Petrolisthes cinctipes TaxID=88211 RepID=A0AAE1K8B5_PETCI|nr:hypothetical protein Pcinc_027662 [Petrolisthes cinctipes]
MEQEQTNLRQSPTCTCTSENPEELLDTTRRNLKNLKKNGEHCKFTYDSVFIDILFHFRLSLCPHNFQEVLHLGWEAATQGHKIDPKLRTKFYLATEAAECLARQSVHVTAQWEDAVQFMIKIFIEVGEENLFVGPYHTRSLKNWVLSVLCYADWCPNYHIRIQMLGIIQLWCKKGQFKNSNIGETIAFGLMKLSEYLDAEEYLLPHGTGLNLDSAWFKIMYVLYTDGCLLVTYHKAALQIKSLRVGNEARWLARVVELVATRNNLVTMKLLECRCWDSYQAVQLIMKSLYLLKVLVFSLHSVETFSSFGFARVALTALIQVTSSTLAVIPTIRAECARPNKAITEENEAELSEEILREALDDKIRALTFIWNYLMTSPKSKTLLTILKRDYGEELNRINSSATKADIQIFLLPQAEEDDMANCPDRLLDGVTMSVMESPVLLHKSQVTVDESTLVYLLLQKSPQCPFTRTPLHHDSFCRLPDLQQEIHAWRKEGSCSHHE